jgi:hypothetical protein
MSHDDQIGAHKARPESESGHKAGEGGPLDPGVQPAQHLTPGMLDPDDLLDALREDTGGSGAGSAAHGSGAIKAQPGAGTIKAKPGATALKPKPGAGHAAPKPPHGTSKPPRQGGSGGGGRSKVPGS